MGGAGNAGVVGSDQHLEQEPALSLFGTVVDAGKQCLQILTVCCCDTSFSSAMPYLWLLSNLGCNNNSGKTKLLVKHNQEDEPNHGGDSGQEERWGKRSSRVQ